MAICKHTVLICSFTFWNNQMFSCSHTLKTDVTLKHVENLVVDDDILKFFHQRRCLFLLILKCSICHFMIKTVVVLGAILRAWTPTMITLNLCPRYKNRFYVLLLLNSSLQVCNPLLGGGSHCDYGESE
jgi:hypothetical protein